MGNTGVCEEQTVETSVCVFLTADLLFIVVKHKAGSAPELREVLLCPGPIAAHTQHCTLLNTL